MPCYRPACQHHSSKWGRIHDLQVPLKMWNQAVQTPFHLVMLYTLYSVHTTSSSRFISTHLPAWTVCLHAAPSSLERCSKRKGPNTASKRVSTPERIGYDASLPSNQKVQSNHVLRAKNAGQHMPAADCRFHAGRNPETAPYHTMHLVHAIVHCLQACSSLRTPERSVGYKCIVQSL